MNGYESEYDWRALEAFFYYRGRLVRPPFLRRDLWLLTLSVRNGTETFFPTIALPGPPPENLKYREGQPLRNQPLVSVVGIPATRNVTYTAMEEIEYILRRAGFPAIVPLFEKLLPETVRNAPIRHVLPSFRALHLNVEKIPVGEDEEDVEEVVEVPDEEGR